MSEISQLEEHDLVVLPDGSLCRPGRTMDRYGRSRGKSESGTSDSRTETERDRGRLQYSPFLRRLAGVTQVVSPELTNSRLHSRASHTHKVAMIAREIGENLTRRARHDGVIAAAISEAGGLDVTACEVAGLAHDLGHPPFGHAGEHELNSKLRGGRAGVREGFEGNAQSFRILTLLDRHKYDKGLDLTNVTLAAVLKYPWPRPPEVGDGQINDLPKFGAYESEVGELRRVRLAVYPQNSDADWDWEFGDKPIQTLEASIMDLADDIAYSIHDLEDFVLQGFVDLGAAIDGLNNYDPVRLQSPFRQESGTLAKKHPTEFDVGIYVGAVKQAASILELLNAPHVSIDLREQHVRGRLASVVGEFFDGVTITRGVGVANVGLASPQWHLMQVLKQVTKQYLVTTSRMSQIQRAQKVAISRLFDGLADWLVDAEDMRAIPEQLSICLENVSVDRAGGEGLSEAHYRAIVDYVCSMSDSEAFLRAQWATGTEIPGMVNLGVIA